MLFTLSKTNHAAFAPRVKAFSKYFTGLLISDLLLASWALSTTLAPGLAAKPAAIPVSAFEQSPQEFPTALHPPHIELLMKCYGRKIAMPNRETTNGADLQSIDKKSHQMVM
jgi:hypothetical protein